MWITEGAAPLTQPALSSNQSFNALIVGSGPFPDCGESLHSSVTLMASMFEIQTTQESRQTGVSVVHWPTSISQSIMRK